MTEISRVSLENETDKRSPRRGCSKPSGIGISKQNLTRIFDKYFREDVAAGKYSGFGTDLYITLDIIREDHGTIWAENNEAAGSSFYFTLPITKLVPA